MVSLVASGLADDHGASSNLQDGDGHKPWGLQQTGVSINVPLNPHLGLGFSFRLTGSGGGGGYMELC
jgi:hypothetical protein